MSQEETRKAEDTTRSNGMRKWLILAGLVLLAFLIGFIPMWMSNRQLTDDLKARDAELRRSRISNTLSSATIYARRGEYEIARQNASSFFTEVRSEIDKANSGVLTEPERNGLSRVMTERDEIITLLSRSDPSSAERLSNLYVEYEAATGKK